MARWKVTLGFQMSIFGPSESYITPDTPVTDVTPVIQALINARNDLLSSDVKWAGVRIANAQERSRSVFYPPGRFQPFVATQNLQIPVQGIFGNNPNVQPDQARACLQVRLRFNDDRRVMRYLSFVPDIVLNNEPGSWNPDGNPGWNDRFNVFRALLVSAGWSIRAVQRLPFTPPAPDPNKFPIVNWVSTAGPPAAIGFVLPNAPPPGIQRRQFVRVVNVRRRGTDKLSYNGRYVVQTLVANVNDATTTYFLRGTEDGDVDSIKLLGDVMPIVYTYYPIQLMEAIRAGVHKRGKPLGSVSGRRKSRASLDP